MSTTPPVPMPAAPDLPRLEVAAGRASRVLLRPLTPADAHDLFAIYGDADTMRHASDDPFPSPDTVALMLDSVATLLARRESFEWGIEETVSQRLIGTCGLHGFDAGREAAEIGCLLRRDRWGQGLMPEALSLLLEWARTQGVRHLKADIDPDNLRSQALFRRLGFAPGAQGPWHRTLPPAEMQVAVAPCRLGTVLVARRPAGLCAILLGDDAQILLQDLRRRFPDAAPGPGDAAFQDQVAQVVAFIEQPGLGLSLPLDLQGTAFQRRVWQALRDLPAGHTITYAGLAARIGSPRAVRAVAGACAANPLAVAVPCHRVVRSDGALSGYRWGVERKRTLLSMEGLPSTLSPASRQAAPPPGS